ncbi:MAG: major facilitator superfamily 1 [Arthrobacter sp.]|jgi:MFS family permease|nr:major facilitator superfamily 1 [Arthrobacter sp.]
MPEQTTEPQTMEPVGATPARHLARGTGPGRPWRVPRQLGFVAASCSLVGVFAAAGTPIPLYNTYRAEDGITNGDLATAGVFYFVAAALSLLVFGRLSNHLGRRPLALTALLSAAAGCLVLTAVHSVLPFVLGRLLQGMACGVAASGLSSYVIDCAPERPRWLPAVITGSAPMVGVPVGALTSGALVQYGPAPRVLVYTILATVLVLCAVITAVSPETVRRCRGALASLRPCLPVPAGAGRLFLAVGASYVGTWSLGGFYQAFGPSLAADQLGTTNPLVAAAVFVSVMILNPIGGPLAARLSSAASLRAGMVLYLFALTGIVFSLAVGAVIPFLMASLVVGVAQGAASTGGLRELLSAARPEDRAGLLSAIYLVAYGGTAVPGIIAGEFARSLSSFQMAVGYAVLAAIAAAIALIAARSPRPGPAIARPRQRPSSGSPEVRHVDHKA